jgi:NAD(P)-dependent dehydrogenase (short-subunit alcohol dehydrogenase family)
MRIEGCVAIVAGGGSGLGAATARMLAGRGARVAVLDFDGGRAEAVADAIGGHAARCDVADEAAVAAAVEGVAGALGEAARIVVNCAGIADAARMVNRRGEVATELFRRVIGVNLLGSYNVMAHAVRAMGGLPEVDGARGVVVNTASAAFQDGQVGQSAYAASKGAVAAMCLPLARELAGQGVRVCAVAPGLFDTPMMEGLPAEVTEKIVADVQFPRRLGRPEEFALMVCQIVENDYLNGEVIRLDGATRLPPR